MNKKSIKFTSSNIISLRDEICKTKTRYWKIIKSENIMSNKEKKAGVGSGFDLKVLHNQILQMSEKLIKVKLMLNAINNGITKFDYDEAKKTHYYRIFKAVDDISAEFGPQKPAGAQIQHAYASCGHWVMD